MPRTHSMESIRCIAALALSAWLFGAGAAWSAEVRGSDSGSHGQIELEWEQPPEYRMLREGNRAIIVFDRQIGDGAARAFRRVGSYIEEGRVIGGGSTILLVLNPSVSLVDRQIDSTVVLEFRPPAAAAIHAAPSEPPVPMTALDLPPTDPPALDLSATPEPRPPAPPGERPTIRVRGGEHPGYSRIVFDWPEPVGYRVEQDAGNLRIAFDTPANADFARAAPVNLSRVDALLQVGDSGGLVVSVAVPPDSRLRHFQTGPKVVVDVLDGDGDGTPVTTRAEVRVPAPTPAPEPPSPPAAEPAAEIPAPMSVASREPSARVPHASLGGDVDDSGLVEETEPTPVAQSAAADPAEAEAERDVGAPLSLLPRPSPHRSPVEVEILQEEPVARFDPGVSSALAVFERGSSLWLVFAAESRLDANALASQGSPALGSVDVVRAEGGIALRFQPDQGHEVVVSRRGTEWTVALKAAAIRSAGTLNLVPQPDYPLGPRLLVGGGTGQSLVRLTDPLVGDVLIVAPVHEPSVGLLEDVRFAQVRLLSSVQGVVARPMSESLAMRVARDGIEITDTGGLLLSSSMDTAREVIAIAPPIDAEDRLLEIEVWRGLEGDGFIARRQQLEKTLATAPESDRDRARLEFARFNFAHGLAQEALGLLELVEESQPSIAGRQNFVILRGAARVLAAEYDAAAADLNHPGLAGSRDAALWRAVAAAKSEDWPRASAEFERAGRLIETYPRPFADMLVRLAARTAIAMNNPSAAEDQLTRLSALTDGESDDWASTNYLRGVMADRDGDIAAATAAFESAAGADDRYYRTLSELALIEIDLSEGGIDWETAVASFESLRFAWRGDQLEFDLIDRIDSLYWQAGHYRKSLETLQQSARSFPETPAGEAYEARLQARFVELFGSDRILSMSPLAAISLYRDYAKLMPADEDGDRVLRGLAERLVEIDLLDQAGDILAELIQERLDGQQKARTGTRLAGIRLLSGQPEAAIEALDASREEARALPALTEERRLLRAHALAELGQAADALDLLAADHSPIAAAAKAEIAWRRQDWAVAVDALTELVEPPPPAGSPIVDAELVLNLGIALALANDAQGLRRLADRYGAAMALSPSANTFAILTRSPGGTPQIADLAAIRQQVSEVDLFQEFLRGYRTADGPGS